MWSRYFALFCILIFAAAVRAQRIPHPAPIAGQINGQVRYSEGGRPAELVLVKLEFFGGGIVAEATTDRNGKFRFADLPGELFIVSVKVPGFREVQQQVDLRTQLTDYIQLQLVSDSTLTTTTTRIAAVVDANVPHNAAVEFEKGSTALFKTHNVDEGIGHLEKAVTIYPKYSAALLLLGTAYMDKRNWDKAEASLRQLLTLEPKSAAAHLALGEAFLDEKKYAEAKDELMSAVTLDPKSAPAHLTLGRLYYELGDMAKAGPQVGMALQINPHFAHAHLLAGNILLRARQLDNALVEFEEYLRLDPNGEYSAEATQAVRRIKEALGKR